MSARGVVVSGSLHRAPATLTVEFPREKFPAMMHLSRFSPSAVVGLSIVVAMIPWAAVPAAPPNWVLRDGDRGFIETALIAALPEAVLTFRNLGWSGDTVWAESRGVFDPAAKGYERMLGLVRELPPGRGEAGRPG